MVYLGLNSVKDIITTFSIIDDINWTDYQVKAFDDIFHHSTLVNEFVQYIYSLLPGTIKFEPFPAVGITHDIGKLIILQYYPERYETTKINQEKNQEMSFYESELDLGYRDKTHCEIGAYFLNWWNFPEVIVESALFHHNTENATEQYQALIKAINYTDNIINYLLQHADNEDVDSTLLQFENIDTQKLEKIISKIKQEVFCTVA